MAGTESTATELQTYLDTYFVSGTGAFKMTSLKQFMENMIVSNYWAQEQKGSASLTGGLGSTEVFDTAFSAGTTYNLLYRCYDASGNSVAATITNLTVTGFTIVTAANCTIEYVATKKV